ncbi:MAG TPA: hypothetical protein VHF24_08225 [Acidimicrobiales bacterium]|nr:hypothetical protein [Acidimicrobiales bacterium]
MSETPQGTYTDWFWPPPPVGADGLTGYSSFEHSLTVEVDPGPQASYFYAHQFTLVGGAGGYLGLQTRGRADGTWGRIAIFSIWDAVAARGPAPVRFTGEGEGWTCRIMYPWQGGRPYRMHLRTRARAWWVASVADAVTGNETEIGWIQVPHRWQRLDGWSVMWTEWYGGPLARCADLPHSSVVFHTPSADDGRVRPDRASDHLDTGASCDNSRVERLENGSRQEMGVTRS